jgi:hypothetical protein
MSIDNMFELASRSKVRFPYKGLISVEDLWDLPVEALDSIYKTLNAKVKQSNEESLLSKPTKQDSELTMQIEIVKRIVAVKQEEAAARLKAKEQREKKQRLMEILANKQDAELQNKSTEEIQKMLAELE